MFDLKTPVENLHLVGPARAKLLKHLGVHTLEDLLFYFPRMHQDLSDFTDIRELAAGSFATVRGRVTGVRTFRTRVRRMAMTQATVTDGTGQVTCVWFNQPYMQKNIKAGADYIFSGKVALSKGRPQMQNPMFEPVRDNPDQQVHTARLVPFYRLTASLTQKMLRMIVAKFLPAADQLTEFLPAEILRAEKLMDQASAVKSFHFPANGAQLRRAQQRLAFDEIFTTQIRVLQYKKTRQERKSYPVQDRITGGGAQTGGGRTERKSMLGQKVRSLPFELTGSQKTALAEILADLKRPFPANRLLEGDVGSGKTIIAALCMWLAAQNGLQAALLAPTEVLAQQHYASLLKLFLDDMKDGLDIGLMTSSSVRLNCNPVSRDTLLAHVQAGRTRLVMGTHALLDKAVKFKSLALVVIDEQHRFGVQQRSALKAHSNAHLLTMSATPIPRTLALTLYGDLDISILDELPRGRVKIITELVAEDKRALTYQFMDRQLAEGRQAFVVCPLIEESDATGSKSVTAEFRKLAKEVFPHRRIGLLHGKLKPAEKEEVMRRFKDGETDVLVSTSVVEVGVDVPNATVMMIEGAERFGLAQLHQFRGRVGRSTHQSYCFLFSDDPAAAANPRLLAMTQSANGFELAQRDLQIRGSGDLYGTAQSGYGFKVATLANVPLVERSRGYAQKIVDDPAALAALPHLQARLDSMPEIHLE